MLRKTSNLSHHNIRLVTCPPEVQVINWEDHRFKKIRVKLAFRPEYNGRPVKPKLVQFNGWEFNVQALWLMDDEDKYPGEWALGGFGSCDVLFKTTGMSWIASGDVEVINGNNF